MTTKLAALRRLFHQTLLDSVLTIDSSGVPSIADKGQKFSKEVAVLLLQQLGQTRETDRKAGQNSGHAFEQACLQFIEASFACLYHLKPGTWTCTHVKSRRQGGIAEFEQYKHIDTLNGLAKEYAELAASLGNDYTISPDIVISRAPEPDESINQNEAYVDSTVGRLSPIRAANNRTPILHASISCKWTLRSDRAQNARSEALNLIRNRKGRCPNIVVVTAEPTPSRISSLALGTGDIDCVYHFALYELRASIEETGNDEALQLLDIMIEGKRVKDISDLPLDLAI